MLGQLILHIFVFHQLYLDQGLNTPFHGKMFHRIKFTVILLPHVVCLTETQVTVEVNQVLNTALGYQTYW